MITFYNLHNVQYGALYYKSVSVNSTDWKYGVTILDCGHSFVGIVKTYKRVHFKLTRVYTLKLCGLLYASGPSINALKIWESYIPFTCHKKEPPGNIESLICALAHLNRVLHTWGITLFFIYYTPFIWSLLLTISLSCCHTQFRTVSCSRHCHSGLSRGSLRGWAPVCISIQTPDLSSPPNCFHPQLLITTFSSLGPKFWTFLFIWHPTTNSLENLVVS